MRNSYIENYKSEIKHRREDSERLARQFKSDTYEDENGVIRWENNDSVPPKDILEFWDYLGYEFNYEKSLEVKDKEQAEAIRQYKERQKNRTYTEQQLAEMRATFGEGETIVDTITGQEIQL